MPGVVGVGNPEMIHLDNSSYAFSSSTAGKNNRKVESGHGHTQRTRENVFQDVGAAAERRDHSRNYGVSLKAQAFNRT